MLYCWYYYWYCFWCNVEVKRKKRKEREKKVLLFMLLRWKDHLFFPCWSKKKVYSCMCFSEVHWVRKKCNREKRVKIKKKKERERDIHIHISHSLTHKLNSMGKRVTSSSFSFFLFFSSSSTVGCIFSHKIREKEKKTFQAQVKLQVKAIHQKQMCRTVTNRIHPWTSIKRAIDTFGFFGWQVKWWQKKFIQVTKRTLTLSWLDVLFRSVMVRVTTKWHGYKHSHTWQCECVSMSYTFFHFFSLLSFFPSSSSSSSSSTMTSRS